MSKIKRLRNNINNSDWNKESTSLFCLFVGEKLCYDKRHIPTNCSLSSRIYVQPCMDYCWLSGLVILIATKICWTRCRKIYVKLYLPYLLLLLKLWHIVEMWQVLLFYMYYSKRCSSELVEIVPVPSSHVKSTRYSGGFHDLSVTITTVMTMLCQQLL